eukprot:COSAG04_NODE_24284_length_324_cov_0.688889_1_plen_88_part_10
MRDNLIAKGREDVRRALDEQAKPQPPTPNAFVVLAASFSAASFLAPFGSALTTRCWATESGDGEGDGGDGLPADLGEERRCAEGTVAR